MHKQTNGRWGPCRYFGRDEYVGRSIHNYGEYNPDETEMIISLASGLCLDIGANIGCISQALKATGHDVYSFEPQPELFTLLEWNMAHAYGSAKAAGFNVACGSEPGIAKMPKVYYSDKGNFGGLSLNTATMYGSYDVPVVKIDTYNFQDVGFIKMDVEGFEIEALTGSIETIKRCRPILYVEDDRPSNSQKLRQFIESLGYTIEEHKPTLYREKNFFGLKKNIWDRNYASHNLICKPC